jgi:hypothetical protein
MKFSLKIQQLLPTLCLVVFAVFFVLRLLIISSKGTDLAGIEQNVIYSIQTFLHSGQLYFLPSEAPFSITQYSPIYYYLCSFTAKLTGTEADKIHTLYIIGRSWNLFFNIVTAFFVFAYARSLLSLSKNISYFLFLLSFTILVSHNFAARPDSLHDMLGIASIFFFSKYTVTHSQQKQRIILLLVSIILTALAVFSKQSGIQFIIIFGGFALMKGDWKTLGKIILFSAVVYLGLIGIFRYINPAFFQNIIGGVINGIDVKNFISYIIFNKIFIISVWPLILASIFFLVRYNSIFKGSEHERVLSICVLGTLVFATGTALKMGSTVQYYTVFVNLALLYLIKQFSKNLSVQDSTEVAPKNLAIYLYLLLIIAVYGIQNIRIIKNFDHNATLEAQRNAANKTAQYVLQNSVPNSGRYVFANLTTDYTIASRQNINNVLFRNCLVPEMDILEYSTGPSKVIGYKSLEEMLLTGEVEYIIESRPKSRFSILRNLENIRRTRFTLVKEIEGYLIYKYSSK